MKKKTKSRKKSKKKTAKKTVKEKEERPGKTFKQTLENELGLLVSSYWAVQKLRLKSEQRINALSREGWEKKRINQLHEWLDARLMPIETEIEREIKRTVNGHELYSKFLSKVKGIGPITAAGVIWLIRDPRRFRHPGHMFSYLKLAPNADGRLPSAMELGTYKRMLFSKIKRTLRMSRGKYYGLYLKRKKFEIDRGLSKGHAHNRADRWMLKLFLDNAWRAWAQLEGMKTVPKPYVIDKLGHKGFISPKDMTEEMEGD